VLPPQVVLIIVIAIALPIGWLISEFQSRRWPRIVLGCLSLMMCVFLASVFALVERFGYNAWYGTASAQLLDTTIAELEAGRADQLLPHLRELRGKFSPTYENRAHYDQLVEEFAAALPTPPK